MIDFRLFPLVGNKDFLSCVAVINNNKTQCSSFINSFYFQIKNSILHTVLYLHVTKNNDSRPYCGVLNACVRCTIVSEHDNL